MNRKIYMRLMLLPVCLSNSISGLASSNFSLFQYISPMTIAQNTIVADANFQPEFNKNIQARDDQTEDCLRSGICKD
ncbi:hypothetical protein VB713_16555 [Anabaena cylindrica UHCC 0172]|uniref:hypothetical protein n=1 Tax=Anabaena cylindrica TaxID=1165 RepID=UPI002B21E851|nr:hypothetical protein [Anabaena cylindrica]MEA5552554.1 hypothetical protein [Anabaena cylindrica UHCC 0172]